MRLISSVGISPRTRCAKRGNPIIITKSQQYSKGAPTNNQNITNAISYKEKDASTSLGNYKPKASVLISAIKKNLTLLVLKDEKEKLYV